MANFSNRGLRTQLRSWRSRAIAALVTVLVGGLVGLWLWLPSAVLSQVEARAALRGLIVDVDDVQLGWSSVVLQGVRVRGARGTALDVRVEEATVRVSAPSLLFGVRGALRSIEVIKPEVIVDVADSGFEDTVLALRGAAESKASRERADDADAADDAHWPDATVQDASFVLRDGEGALVQVSAASWSSEEAAWKASASQAVVGSRPGEVVTLEGASAAGTLEGHRPKLASLMVTGGLLQWVQDESDGSARGRTLQRLRKAKGQFTQASGPEVGAAAETKGGLARFVTEDVHVDLSGLKVLSARPSGPPATVLKDLAVQLESAGKGRFRARGTGASSGEGRLQWDLYLEPAAARVEGSVALTALPLSLVAPLLPPIPWYRLDESRVDGRLTLKGEGLEKVAAEGELRLAELTIAARGIAHSPVGPFGAVMRGQGTWIPAKRRLELRDASIQSQGARVGLEGAVEWARDHYLFDLVAHLPKTQCADVLAAMPPGLLGELEEVRFAGTFEAGVKAHVDSRALDDTLVDFDFEDDCSFLSLPPLLAAERFRRPFIHKALEPDGGTFEMETGPGTPAWTAIEQVSPFMIQAVVAHEDGRFFRHRGFAEPQIAVALARNLKAGGYKFGASTITMQLVKNVFLHRDKLLARKVQEAMITWWLEQRWSKKDILELYLNVIEYGPSVYGLRNASWYYFGVTPLDLSPAQAAFLATILPSPKRFHGKVADGSLPPRLRDRIERFLRHMQARERIDEEALNFALEELADFRFYREGGQPQKKDVRGTAQEPPFRVGESGFDAWDLDPMEL